MGDWIPTTRDADGAAPSVAYSAGRPSLTGEERAAIESMQAVCEIGLMVEKSPVMAATLRGLLERTR